MVGTLATGGNTCRLVESFVFAMFHADLLDFDLNLEENFRNNTLLLGNFVIIIAEWWCLNQRNEGCMVRNEVVISLIR